MSDIERLLLKVAELEARIAALEARPVEAIGTPIGDFPQSFPFLTSQVAG